ncbi:alpha/beta fold hydrolase [Nocardia sp. BMG111209]|uniref:alpha/beta fold hydrolase n=1 Tax=Nocardia sp. BMG111209 TaxID=1160137 RepID=UPI0003684C56|nr:alpha/beta hydrolase [Nocardia sp. BMG111209]
MTRASEPVSGGAASVFVGNGEIRLHVLDNDRRDSAARPVLVIPGMGEYATEYAWLSDRLGDRRVVVADVRGRGRSDAPERGYTWEDHIGDLRAVADDRALRRPILVAFSRGSSYALGYALERPDEVAGLVVGDYQARHVGLPESVVEQQLRMRIRGTEVAERMSRHAVRGVAAESREVPLWDRLPELRCPVLVLRGDRPSTIVTDELADRWRAALPTAEVATIAGAGHDLWSRDPGAYLAALLPFLDRIG